MNGRIYDPELGRFIQADPLIEPDATQGLNRYTYVLNNPLSATDPSGYLTFRQVVGIAIAVVAAVYGQYYFAKDALALSFGISVAGGFTASYVATGSVEAGLWGAFAAGVFWGIGTAFSDLTSPGVRVVTGNATAKVAAHGAAGGTLNLMQGGKFGHGFASAGITQALSPVIGRAGGNGPKGIVTRAALSAALGGTVSKITGGKFANGAATSAFASLFNDGVHDATDQPQDARNWKFDKDDPNYHFHRFIDEICSVDSVCTLSSAASANRMHPAPGYFENRTPVVDGQYGVAELGYPVELDNFGPVVHSVSADGLTVRNSTVDGHLLHPGYVERTVFENGGKIYMRTVGEGVGVHGSVNDALSKPMWSGLVNSHVRYEISLGYRK